MAFIKTSRISLLFCHLINSILKLEQLTFTRFIAAIMIVFHHYARGFFPFNTSPAHFIVENSNLGVSYFYLLSGFVLVIAYGNKEKIIPAAFYTNRFARIFPLYLFSLLLILVSYIAAHQMNNYLGFALNVFVLQAWYPPEATKFNAQTWSIGVEFFFYFVFPFLVRYVYKKSKLRNVVMLSMVFWIITQILFNYLLQTGYDKGLNTESHNLLYYFPPMHLSTFILGNLAGYYFLNKKKNLFAYHDGLLVLFFIILIFIMSGPTPVSYHNGMMAIVFIPMILVLSEGKGRIARWFSKAPLVYLGEISYGVYILQYPVFIFGYSILRRLQIEDPATRFFLTLLMLLVVAGLCFRWIEMPARKWIQERYRRLQKN